MRHWSQAVVARLKWPVQASVFIGHFLHHTLAFMVWGSLLFHVAVPVVGAGLNIRQIAQEAGNFLNEGRVSWRSVIAAALVPAVIVALRQAYLSWEALHGRLRAEGYAPHHGIYLLKWPVRTSRFLATLLHQTAGFVGWAWILFAVIGSLGEAGSHVSALREAGVKYFVNVSRGDIDWRYLAAAASVPALLLALWNARRAYRRLHAMTAEQVQERVRQLQAAA
jgi:hypothetical protein